MEIKLKRAYEDFNEDDGFRVLVDRIWPRGVSKDDLNLDLWEKSIAPTDELRKEFNHEPEKFPKFKEDYKNELKENDEFDKFLEKIKNKNLVTLIYGAKDEKHNQAVVLKEVIENKLK